MSMVKKALALAARGWAVFPIKADDPAKKPLVKWRDQSTTNPKTIEQWWTRWPKANIGIDTGKSGLLVVDADSATSHKHDGVGKWQEVLFENEDLETDLRTYRVRTPSGGEHWYFVGLSRSRASIWKGIDIRSAAGYVVAAGSIIKGKEYEVEDTAPIAEAPQWLLDACGKREEKEAKRHGFDERFRLDTEENVAKAVHFLQTTEMVSIEGDGGNNKAFQVCCMLRDFGISFDLAYDLLVDYWNDRCTPPWDVSPDADPKDSLLVVLKNAYNYAKRRQGSRTAQADFGTEGDDTDNGVAGDTYTDEDIADLDRGYAEWHEKAHGTKARSGKAEEPKTGAAGEKARKEKKERKKKTNAPDPEDIETARRNADAVDQPRRMPRNYVWVADLARFLYRPDPTGARLDVQAFDREFLFMASGKTKPSAMVFGSPLTYENLDNVRYLPQIRRFSQHQYRPGSPEELDVETYNIWRPSQCLPIEGDETPFVDHIKMLCGDEWDKVVAWLAWIVQTNKRPNFAVLICDRGGTGKSLLAQLLSRVIGRSNAAVIDSARTISRFNSFLESKQLVVVEELMSDEKMHLANNLKSYIGNDRAVIEAKGVDAYEVELFAAFLCFTNYESALQLSNGERRYLIVKTENFGRDIDERDPAYFARLADWMDGPGVGIVRRYLEEYPVDERFGLGKAPLTAAHEEMRRASLGALEDALETAVENGEGPFAPRRTIVAYHEVHQYACSVLRRGQPRHNEISRWIRSKFGGLIFKTTATQEQHSVPKRFYSADLRLSRVRLFALNKITWNEYQGFGVTAADRRIGKWLSELQGTPAEGPARGSEDFPDDQEV